MKTERIAGINRAWHASGHARKHFLDHWGEASRMLRQEYINQFLNAAVGNVSLPFLAGIPAAAIALGRLVREYCKHAGLDPVKSRGIGRFCGVGLLIAGNVAYLAKQSPELRQAVRESFTGLPSAYRNGKNMWNFLHPP